MKLQDFINLCADEDILLELLDDETGDRITVTWKSDFNYMTSDNTRQREVQSYYHTTNGNNLVMEIYIE